MQIQLLPVDLDFFANKVIAIINFNKFHWIKVSSENDLLNFYQN